MFCAIIGFAGWNKEHQCTGVCIAGTRRIAVETRTHPDYVRAIVRYLKRVGLITRVFNPGAGRRTELRPVDKFAWLKANPHGIADRATFQFEETSQEVSVIMMWRRLFDLLPGARKIRYERRMKMNPKVFLSVIEELEDTKRQDGNADRTGKERIRDWVGFFEYTWRKKIEANRK